MKKKKIYPQLSPGQEVFSTFDVSRILEINRERLREWMKFGFIPNGTRVAWKGSYKTVWGKEALYSILLFKRLIDAGLQRRVASAYIEKVEWSNVLRRGDKHLLVAYSSSSKEPNFVYLQKKSSLARIKHQEIVTFVNLQVIINDVEDKI